MLILRCFTVLLHVRLLFWWSTEFEILTLQVFNSLCMPEENIAIYLWYIIFHAWTYTYTWLLLGSMLPTPSLTVLVLLRLKTCDFSELPNPKKMIELYSHDGNYWPATLSPGPIKSLWWYTLFLFSHAFFRPRLKWCLSKFKFTKN